MIQLQKDLGLVFAFNDWCEFAETDLPNRKSTAILTDANWCIAVQKQCSRTHVHGPPLRGRRLHAAAAYPRAYCRELAASMLRHTRADA